MRTSFFRSRMWPPLESSASLATSAANSISSSSSSSSVPSGSPAVTANKSSNRQHPQSPERIRDENFRQHHEFKNTGLMKKAAPLMYRGEAQIGKLQTQLEQLQATHAAQNKGKGTAGAQGRLSKKQRQAETRLKQQMQKFQEDSSFTKIYPRLSRSPEHGDGPVVPPLAYSNQMISRRNFETYPGWCGICNEPISPDPQYARHLSRKDHCLLDQHFEQIVEYQRSWCAEDLLCVGGRLEATFGVPVPQMLQKAQALMAEQERRRRVEINALAAFLIKREIVDPRSSHSIGAASRGSIFGFFLSAHMLLHFLIPGACLHMVPRANIEHCSSIEDYTSSSYNTGESFYDCQSWGTLLAPYFPDGPATTVSHKSTIVRNVMSQLKAAVMQQEDPEFASLRYVLRDFPVPQVDGEKGGESHVEESKRENVSNGTANKQEEEEEEEEDSIENDLKFLSEFARETIQENLARLSTSTNPQQQQRRLQSFSEQKQVKEISVSDVNRPLLSHQQNYGADELSEQEETSSGGGNCEVSSSAAVPLPLQIPSQVAETLMALAGRAIVADLIHLRISEYVVRAEPCWLGKGMMEQTVPRAPVMPLPPRVSISSRPDVESRPYLPNSD